MPVNTARSEVGAANIDDKITVSYPKLRRCNMPAFYLLVFLGIILLWFLLSFLFKPIGRFFHRLWKDAVDAMEEDDNTEQKE